MARCAWFRNVVVITSALHRNAFYDRDPSKDPETQFRTHHT